PIGNAQPSHRAEIHHDTGIPTPGPIVGGEFQDTFGSRRSASNDRPDTGCERPSAVAHRLVECCVEVLRANPRADGKHVVKDMVKNNFPTCLSCSILAAA